MNKIYTRTQTIQADKVSGFCPGCMHSTVIKLIGEVLAVMRQLAKDGMTMLVVTHEMDFARNVSNRVLFMEGGKVIESAPSRQFFEAPREQRSREFIRSILEARQ